ncbi:MAG TPA: pyridoxine 5'-phosphate synthase [Flavobacteriales bacterium]|jgi:pyridoxine 5-phosphate synthase|nr:pyridoxine 5'-phosphate synthase [Flavobacteriales bacterium]
MKTKLSVNINKIATLRNARGGNYPDVIDFAKRAQEYGADGITIHPRPDERHIRYADAKALRPIVYTEFNIEGNPIPKFIDLVLSVKPEQVTLVPDDPNQLTSDHGWDTIRHRDYLQEVIQEFKNNGIRTSIFVDPDLKMVEGAKNTGTDRIELYTESYASEYAKGNKEIVKPFAEAAKLVHEMGLGINAGHDLNLENIKYFKDNVPYLDEVSIGHALVVESLIYGMENVIRMYQNKLH